jgi:hypothetical protein
LTGEVIPAPAAPPPPAATAAAGGVGGGRAGSDRMVVLALVAAVAFNPPLLRVFGAGDTVFGLPLLYTYIFVVWAAVILAAALHIERSGRW